MKTKSLIQILLGLAIVGLAVWLYLSITKPVKFENEYNVRRDACAAKLKAIRTLEEAYKTTYGSFCGDFDTLINRLMTEDSMKIIAKTTNYDKIPEDVDVNEMSEFDALKAGYITRQEVLVNPIQQLRESKKLTLSDDEIRNLRYVPFQDKEEFQLQAGTIERGGFNVPVFECKVDLTVLLNGLDNQLVINKIAELENINRYPGWKVGDMNNAVTDGNFE